MHECKRVTTQLGIHLSSVTVDLGAVVLLRLHRATHQLDVVVELTLDDDTSRDKADDVKEHYDCSRQRGLRRTRRPPLGCWCSPTPVASERSSTSTFLGGNNNSREGGAVGRGTLGLFGLLVVAAAAASGRPSTSTFPRGNGSSREGACCARTGAPSPRDLLL